MIAIMLGWLAVLLVGAAGGGLSAALLLGLRLRRAGRIVVDDVDDDERIDALASAWARDTGRPWAAGLVADKLRLLGRIERSRQRRQRREPSRLRRKVW